VYLGSLEVVATVDDAVGIKDVGHDEEIQLVPTRVLQTMQPEKPA
jgi:hypothetical protein